MQCLYFEGSCDQVASGVEPSDGSVLPCHHCPHVASQSGGSPSADQNALRETLEALEQAGYGPQAVETLDSIAYDTTGAPPKKRSGNSRP